MVNVSVSAIIPAYNSAAFLPDAVRSIRTQTQPVSEIIIIDDGSTDDTQEVVSRLGADIRYVKQTNAGPSASRNRGIELAVNDWVAFLDADDQWTPEKNRTQFAVINKYPELVLIASDMREIGTNDEVLVPSVLEKHHIRERFKQLAGKPLPNAMSELLIKNFIPTGTVLARREILLRLGGFREDIRYGEDLQLWARIAGKHPITCLPEVHMLRRQHGRNATQATSSMLADLVKVMTSIRELEARQLRLQGSDPDRLLANAWWDLGYWHFLNANKKQANLAFRESIKEKPTSRAFMYYVVNRLPAPVIDRLRSVKRQILGFREQS